MTTRPQPDRSLVRRLSLLFTALGLAAMLASAAMLIGAARTTLRRDLARTIDTDVAALADAMDVGGVAALQRQIGARIALLPLDGDVPLYLLLDPRGKRIAGNMAVLPPLDPAASQFGETPVNGAPALVRATRLRGGTTLVVGRSLAPVARVTGHLWRLFGWIAAALLLVALLAGRWIAARVGGRLQRLIALFERFERGDLLARSNAAAHGDEIDRLAGHIDQHLEKTRDLIVAQREITDNIAHELRTPLVHLDTRLVRALDQGPDKAIAVELDAARADVRSVVALFDGLLDIAVADTGRDPAARQLVDLSEVTGDLAELYAASAEEAGIGLVVAIAPNVTIRGERMQLSRLVANLLDNALKYVPAGARVRIEVSPGPRLIVEDDGPGIPAADRQRIFERFTRSGGSPHGHGLGLALVRVIAMRHGLSVRVEDARPGARFIVEGEQ